MGTYADLLRQLADELDGDFKGSLEHVTKELALVVHTFLCMQGLDVISAETKGTE